ncbi:MAG TPA: hypothetical protein VHV08_17540, partial [Pirellulales bacterium]|nr:hypothetical protein [Pirellulales bacterium]
MDRRVSEGIEACRPASDDICQADLAHVAAALEHDPAARMQYERVQKWDARVTQAMEHVEVPAGLTERILERLQAAKAAGAPSPCEAMLAEAPSADTL